MLDCAIYFFLSSVFSAGGNVSIPVCTSSSGGKFPPRGGRVGRGEPSSSSFVLSKIRESNGEINSAMKAISRNRGIFLIR